MLFRSGPYGLAVASRIPITAAAELAPHARGTVLRVVLSGDVQLLVAHPPPPFTAERLAQQRSACAALAAHADARTIVAGDFNCTPYAPAFAELLRAGRLTDTAPGPLHVPTWGPLLNLLPIDHVLCGDAFAVATHRVLDRLGSDHAALLVELHLRARPPVASRAAGIESTPP